MPSAVPFLDLYSCARDLQAIISTTWIGLLTKSFWGPIFRRNLTETKERHLLCLLNDLYKIFIPEGGQDFKVWVCSHDGVFSYLPSSLLSRTILLQLLSWNLFEWLRLPRGCWCSDFALLALRGRIRHYKRIVVNACPLCLSAEESLDPLLLNCKVAFRLWDLVLAKFDCRWVLPNSIPDLFQSWKLAVAGRISKGEDFMVLVFCFINLDHLEGKEPKMLWMIYFL